MDDGSRCVPARGPPHGDGWRHDSRSVALGVTNAGRGVALERLPVAVRPRPRRPDCVEERRGRGGTVAGVSLDLGALVGAAQAFASALDGGYELREVELERVEDLVGVALGAQSDLVLAAARVLDDLLRGALGLADELMLGDELGLAFARFRGDPVDLALWPRPGCRGAPGRSSALLRSPRGSSCASGRGCREFLACSRARRR